MRGPSSSYGYSCSKGRWIPSPPTSDEELCLNENMAPRRPRLTGLSAEKGGLLLSASSGPFKSLAFHLRVLTAQGLRAGLIELWAVQEMLVLPSGGIPFQGK